MGSTLGTRALVPAHFITLATASVTLVACEPPLDIGAWKCAAAPLFIPPDGSPIPAGKDTIVTPDWETSFEDGFCGYSKAHGFCYAARDAEVSIVDTIVRSGRKAAKFSITTDPEKEGEQTRCVREGTLPQDAYYGAWFYLPRGTTSRDNWNLFHFRGESAENPLHILWDVSVYSTNDGRNLPWLRGFVAEGESFAPSVDWELPAEEWFSLHLRLLRSSTATGKVELYLNGELIEERDEIVTDDSEWGQWYVGNLGRTLEPAESTIYIDDVSIRSTLITD